MKNISLIKKAVCATLAGALLVNVCACTSKMSDDTVDLMKNVSVKSGNTLEPNDEFIAGTADFAVELFKNSAEGTKNTMVSPLSVMSALAMTANGAKGDTLEQMNKTLCGSMSIDELNQYLSGFVSNLPKSNKASLFSANSIWVKNGFDVDKDFLKTNAQYYNADAYSVPFNDETVKDINNWVSDKTDGQIKEMVDGIPSDSVMYLINALTFDAEWETIYREDQVQEDVFNGTNGSQKVDMMSAEESLYLDDGQATGFIKPYADGYSFAALLPNEDVKIEDYIANMSGEKFINTLKNAKSESVQASIPKFESEYSAELNDVLKTLGMTDAFDGSKADFSGINSDIDLCISRVIHKTRIAVDEKGTKAGAATAVELRCMGAFEINTVYLDRPFVYAIIENETNLPLFIGAVMNVG